MLDSPNRPFVLRPSVLRIEVITVAVALLSVTIATASSSSMPGNVLYPVKRTVEKVRIGLARDHKAKKALQIMVTKERMNELRSLRKDSPYDPKLAAELISSIDAIEDTLSIRDLREIRSELIEIALDKPVAARNVLNETSLDEIAMPRLAYKDPVGATKSEDTQSNTVADKSLPSDTGLSQLASASLDSYNNVMKGSEHQKPGKRSAIKDNIVDNKTDHGNGKVKGNGQGQGQSNNQGNGNGNGNGNGRNK